MADPRLTRILATGALAATLVGGPVTSSHAISLPVTSVHEIAGSAPTEQVRWGGGWGGFRGGGYGFRGYGWGGYGGGWRRPYYGGGALAAGLVGGLALGTLAASAGSYYGSGYGYYPSSYAYPGYSYGYYPSSYAYPSYYSQSYYSYPSYYGASYYGTSYGWGYGNGYWASGKRGHKHARKPGHR
jgi:hypothetical protein